MRNLTKTLIATAAATAALAPAASAASADTLVADAPGARNLAGAGGYLAWSSPTPDGQWRLNVRGPDGRIARPDPWTSRSPLHGIVTDFSEPEFHLDDQGVKRFDPRPFHGR